MWEDDDNDDGTGLNSGTSKNTEALPIYKKALEILDLTEQIVDTFGDASLARRHRENMMEDAMMLPAKIAGAEAMDYYVHKMENATVVKIHARSLLTQTASIKYLGLVNEQYGQLLRDEIEVFRLLFKDWVKSFEINTIKEGDGWGLFVSDDE